MARRQNVERDPWLSLTLRLSAREVAEIARRRVVGGRTASRLLEAVAVECDSYVRYQHGATMPRRRKGRV